MIAAVGIGLLAFGGLLIWSAITGGSAFGVLKESIGLGE